jgi:hypothetical protein
MTSFCVGGFYCTTTHKGARLSQPLFFKSVTHLATKDLIAQKLLGSPADFNHPVIARFG